jgi:voltage-gated potassium channel
MGILRRGTVVVVYVMDLGYPSLVLGQIVLWGSFVLAEQRGSSMASTVLVVGMSMATIAYGAYVTIDAASSRLVTMAAIIRLAVFTVLFLVGSFSRFYFSYGTHHNWSVRLSHLDALLLSVGILTTAGTGDVQPHSELARGLITAQMSVDILVVTVMAAVVLHVFITSRTQADSS